MGETKPELVSIVVPCYNEAEVFPLLEAALAGVADRLQPAFRVEVILVDDGSRDDTWARIQSCAGRDRRFRGVALSRNFGHQMALTCGYDLAQGDAVVSIDADLQDPPDVILELVEQWKQGHDIVYAVRTDRHGEGRLKRWTASLFYRAMHFLGARHVHQDSGDFRLLSRRSLDALSRLREQHRFIRGMVGWIGFRTGEVRYVRRPRAAGVTKYPPGKMIRLALDAMVSFSITPLRLTYLSAAFLSLIVLGYLGYAAVRYFVYGDALVRGWTSLILAIMAFGALNLICIGIVGEYVGRTYEQTKNRPLYLLRNVTDGGDSQGPFSFPGGGRAE